MLGLEFMLEKQHKEDWEVGNYFYNKRRAEGTLNSKPTEKGSKLHKVWNVLVALFWAWIWFVIIYSLIKNKIL